MIGFSIALVAAENSWLLGGKDRRVPMVVGVGTLLFAGIALGGFVKVSPLAFVGLALFSICHFGLLRTASHPARLRAAVAFAFGLVHGFGFAGVLDEMQLDSSRLLPALFGFNAGVEVGQLALVALVWPLLRLLARQRDGHWHRQLAKIGSAAICGLGIFWFVTRIFG
ncbi:MAG: HupE/UreJ family protein [bacterium]|nr:HupE/UreJ family protein [bacterium]